MAVGEGQVYNLATEDDAWELLAEFAAGRIDIADVSQVTFGDWANVTVYIPDDRYDSAITPYMMQGWLDLQRSIYRSYALADGGNRDGRRLSDRDKEKLELVVKVEKGSSNQIVDFQAIIEKVAGALVDKLTPSQIIAVMISLGLVYAGQSVLKVWLNNKKEVKLAEIEGMKDAAISAERTHALDAVVALAAPDRDRQRVLERVAQQVPVVREISEEAEQGRESLVKHVTKVDAVVNDVAIPSEVGQIVTSTTRTAAVEERLDGVYTIRRVDTTVATGFRVLIAARNGSEFSADVAEVMTTLGDRQVIRDAEWAKTPVFLQINGKVRRGEVTEATIVRARAYDPETDD